MVPAELAATHVPALVLPAAVGVLCLTSAVTVILAFYCEGGQAAREVVRPATALKADDAGAAATGTVAVVVATAATHGRVPIAPAHLSQQQQRYKLQQQ